MQISITGSTFSGSGSGGGGTGITTASAPIVTVALSGTDPNENPSELRFGSKSLFQKSTAINAANIKQFLRGNKEINWSFKVARVHDTPEISAYFLAFHETQFPILGILKYETDAGDLLYANAAVEVPQGELRGCTTIHTYSIVSGGASTDSSGGLTTD